MAGEQVKLGYSQKNIPVSSRMEFRQTLIQRTKAFLRSMTIKATLFLNNVIPEAKETFGLKSPWEPDRLPEMREFEESMLDMIQNVKFKNQSKSSGPFQKNLQQDINKIKKDQNLYVKADKSTNYYKMSKETYESYWDQTIQKDYKKCNPEEIDLLIQEEKKFASKLKIDDRMDVPAQSDSYINLKDHKPNYRNSPLFRLINTNKGNLGIVSQQILQDVNNELRTSLGLNQWRSTQDVLTWFENIGEKQRKHFIQFDIVDFYPSISEDLLRRSLEFARTRVNITEEHQNLIITANNSVLYAKSQPWKKKNSNTFFDITQGSYPGAENCELVGLYILSQLQEIGEDCGLYRDDGLLVSKLTKRQNENLKKNICQIFQRNNLKITINANLKVVDFLDVTLNLEDGNIKPYMKPNNTILYVDVASNHPPGVLRNIPESVNKRLSSVSKNEEIFKNSIGPYQEALNKSGHNYELHFAPNNSQRRNRRKRNIIWFNPPYCKSVRTNIGSEFLKILDKCFPSSNKLSKIFNRNSVKISYSCMPNIGKIISGQNKQKLRGEKEPPPCKCSLFPCPVEGQCETSGVIYQCIVKETDSGKSESYVGLTANTFKDRFYKHRSSINNENYHKNTFSKHIWSLKRRHVNFELSWRLISKARPYSPSSKCCDLCIREIYYIMYDRKKATLNKRNEFFGYCLHKDKYLLANQ